jgi:cyanate permease
VPDYPGSAPDRYFSCRPPYFSDFSVVFLLSITVGFGLAISTVATGSYIGEIVTKKEIGASMGALSSTMDIGHSLGPLVTGFIIGFTTSYEMGFMAGFLLILVAFVFFTLSVIKNQKK